MLKNREQRKRQQWRVFGFLLDQQLGTILSNASIFLLLHFNEKIIICGIR